jgi:hypothetical protein
MNTHEAKNSGNEESKKTRAIDSQNDFCSGVSSRKIKIAIVVVGFFLIVFISFAGGVAVGLKKARFSYKFGENYERNFVGPRMGMIDHRGPGKLGFPGGPGGSDFRNGHGLAGTIISISDNNLIVKDKDGKENTVTVTDKTIIKRQREDIKISDLKQDDQIVVMGSPGDNGVINADLIRIFENNGRNQ